MKIYPSGQVTRHGAQVLKDRVNPLIIYTSHDNAIQWYLSGGLAPMPGVQAGAVLADGAAGLFPPFAHVEQKGARQDGTTWQHTVYDPAEMDLQVEFTAPPNNSRPHEAAAEIRKVIRDWMASWDPKKPGTLSYITPDNGKWWCNPRLFKSPPEKQFASQGHRLRQRYTWTVRNDDAFWKGTDSVSVLSQAQIETTQIAADNQVTFNFDEPIDGSLGTRWNLDYSGPGAGVFEVNPAQGGAVWNPSGTSDREVVATLQGSNAVQTVATTDHVATGGTFRLGVPPSLGTDETTDLPFDASAGDVQAAYEALPAIGAGNVRVSGPDGGPYTIEFQNALGLQPVDLVVPHSDLTGSTPGLEAGDAQAGASGDVAAGTTSVTVTTGELYQPPGSGDAPGGAMGDPVEQPGINLFGWFDEDQQTGVKGTLTTGGFGIISTIIGGITQVIKVGAQIIGSIANAVVTLVTEVVEVAVGIFQQVVSLIVNGIKLVAAIIGAIIGTVFALVGIGLRIIGDVVGQILPPPVTGGGAGAPVVTKSGELTLTNIGDQDGYPRYLVYGPGTFRIANGPNSTEMIEFGPLVDGQIGLLTTLPRLRGVVDLTPSTASLAVTPEFDDFVSKLVSLATNNNVPPLLEWFQSLFGVRPPQGHMYALLKGRFSRPIPPKTPGLPAEPVKIACEILNGGASSKVVAALTPLRRWPE